MVHTRGQGARPEGFSEYNPARRERKPTAAAPARPRVAHPRPPRYAAPALSNSFVPPSREASTQTRVVYLNASTQTDVNLTSFSEPASAKRRRDADESPGDNASKRRKAVTPEPKFLFSKTRNRSFLTSAPPKFGGRRESPYFDRIIEPTSTPSPPESELQRPGSRERLRPVQTTTPPPAQGGIFGSVRRIFGYLTGAAQNEAEQQVQEEGGPSELDAEATPTSEYQEIDEQGSPTPASRIAEPTSPTPDAEILDSGIYTREFFKRRRTANTIAGREQLEAMRKSIEEGPTDFDPVETPGSSKRKLASVAGQVPGPRRGGFGIEDGYSDDENEVESVDESQRADAQPSTPANKLAYQTPLRSALRQTTAVGTNGRSAKSVRINPVNSVKSIYGTYGRSGEYRGSMFSEISTNSDSSISANDIRSMISPTTAQNTKVNETPKFRLDTSIVDPNDATWRPSLANPRPGHFRVPDSDEFDDEDEDDAVILAQDEVPPQPSTPRMSHAELPQASPLNGNSSFTGPTDSIMANDTQEIRLNKARSEAQKYKPAKSSRLSLSEKARSRSSSPPNRDADFTESQSETIARISDPTPAVALSDTTTEETSPPTPQPLGREDLDNTIIGKDDMTDYQREHQYDEWALNLDWPAPQSYVDAGVSSSYIDELVRKNWTERDTRESIEFWEREFEQGLKAAREAKEQGRELVWVTDPDEILELERLREREMQGSGTA